MNILAIVGSLRKDSLNRMVMENYMALAGSEAQFSEALIDDLPLYNFDIEQKGFPEPVTRLGDQIRKADGVVFFSPEYNGSIPGVLKNAIDWVSRLKNQPFARKPVGIVGASTGRLGTSRMQYHLRQVGVLLDMRCINKPEIMIANASQIFNDQRRIIDEPTLKVLRLHFEALRDSIQAQ